MLHMLLNYEVYPVAAFHTVQCWHVDRYSPCSCGDDLSHCAPINIIQTVLEDAYIRDFISVFSAAQGLDPNPYEVLDALWFILSKDFAANRLLIPVYAMSSSAVALR